jgi:hypothetical protein
MSCRAGVQCSQSKARPSVHEATIFGAERKVPCQFVVSAAPIHERCFGLALRTRNKSSLITCGIEDERTNTREGEGIESENAVWRRYHDRTCGLVHISLHTEPAGGMRFCCVFLA